jgi:hypothetical protein
VRRVSSAIERPFSKVVNPGGSLPMVESTPTFNQTLRYVASANANNLTFSRADLLGVFQMAVSSSTGYRLLNSVKINWIDLYLPPVSGGSQSISFAWLSEYAKSKVIVLSTMGTAEIAYTRIRPPVDTTAPFFSITGSGEVDPLFSIDVLTSMVLDINLSFTYQNFVATAIAGNFLNTSTKTLTAGAIYTAALDGTSTNIMVPAGRLQF